MEAVLAASTQPPCMLGGTNVRAPLVHLERRFLLEGTWANALAAADFSAAVLLGFASTFPAADAAFLPVTLFRLALRAIFLITSLRPSCCRLGWHALSHGDQHVHHQAARVTSHSTRREVIWEVM